MLILSGKQVETPFVSKSWLDEVSARIGPKDRANRTTTWIRGITLHTTNGSAPQPIKPGAGRSGAALQNIFYWNSSSSYASSHLLVDRDGVVFQTADLIAEQTWHATSVNNVSVGVEICQGSDGSLFQKQLDVVVSMCDWLTAQLGIQRQVPLAYTGKVISRLSSGGKDVVGVYGHRDQTSNRGKGDPGDAVMDALVAAGYERFDLEAGADKAAWQQRQKTLGITADGVPGPATLAALKAAGYADGMWVKR